jgi:hypothetical protein
MVWLDGRGNIGEGDMMRCNGWNPNTIAILALSILMVMAPLASAFSGLGGTSTGSSMGSLGQQSQPTQGMQPTGQNATELSSPVETPSSSSQLGANSNGSTQLPTSDPSQQTLSEQAGSTQRQLPQSDSVQLPLSDPSEPRDAIKPSPPE